MALPRDLAVAVVVLATQALAEVLGPIAYVRVVSRQPIRTPRARNPQTVPVIAYAMLSPRKRSTGPPPRRLRDRNGSSNSQYRNHDSCQAAA
ncbi:hypothetical protein [Streptomyces sp. NPDC091027]|uniref:hypothetical protein n=1 Tax=Streptomyces sp. NPDC091027 TaxID=3365971 RepID=UPI003800898E